jgi:DNA helicase-2/ATP-dependent DNA helicase PcrA
MNVADGCLPSDLATAHPDQIEVERRLLYVAMTRAKNALYLVHPLRFFIRQQAKRGDKHVFTPRTRFIPDAITGLFERVVPAGAPGDLAAGRLGGGVRVDVGARLRAIWAAPS